MVVKAGGGELLAGARVDSTKHAERRADWDLELQGKHLQYQRGKRNNNPSISLVKIEGVDSPKDAAYYLGKKVAFVYRGKREIQGSKIRVCLDEKALGKECGSSWFCTSSGERSPVLTATPVLCAPSSATTSPPSPSVLPSASCSTPQPSKRRIYGRGC